MNTPDPRFFENLGPLTLAALIEPLGARCDAAAASGTVDAVAILGRADARSVSFFSDRRLADEARATKAVACFVTEDDEPVLPAGCVALITPAPHLAWAMAAQRLHRPRRLDPAAPAVHPRALLEEGVSVGPGAVIGADAQIGAGTEIGANAVIGPGVAVGRGCRIGACASVSFALIGDRVQISAGAVIGEPGFGVTGGPKGLVDVPQLGRVILQDGVSIGAQTCVDRGAYDDTVIGENSKIDNLVQIAHNVMIGRNCVVAGHCGISGSVVLGDGVRLGGRVGLADHVKIGAGAELGASSGVMHDVPPGERWFGIPAKPARQQFREVAWLTRAASRRGGGGEA